MAKKRMAVLRFELPFAADPPRLTSEEMGLPRIVRRPAASYTMDVTVLDAADARLLRAGVVVAHRVVGGQGDWYLAAPAWAPHLPAERVEPVQASGDLPERFAALIRPIARRAPIGPLAGLTVERDEWSLRDGEGRAAAAVRDERVTVRRSGMTTARYREVTVTPTTGLTRRQRDFLVNAAVAVHGAVTEHFPNLQSRIGAPASGLSGFPQPAALSSSSTLEEYVAAIFARHLRGLVEADLDRRHADDEEGIGVVNDRLWAFRRDLRGLAAFLEPGWREEVERRLAGLAFETAAQLDEPVLGVVDALVSAVYAPPLGDESNAPAREALLQRVSQAASILDGRCQALTIDAPDERWAGALSAAQQLGMLISVAEDAVSPAKGLRSRCDEIVARLTEAARPSPPEPDLDGLSLQQAYRMGERAERRRGELARLREEFIATWVGQARKLAKRTRKP